MARGNEPFIGDRVHHEGRKHPTKAGWMQANGEIVSVLRDEDDEHDVIEVFVVFGEDDSDFYETDQLEWCDGLGGYWRVA